MKLRRRIYYSSAQRSEIWDRHFASHETVKHSAKEYARGDVNTNSVEGFFSIFKRGMKGVYQHYDEKHLPRYLAEFDFRYNHPAWLHRRGTRGRCHQGRRRKTSDALHIAEQIEL